MTILYHDVKSAIDALESEISGLDWQNSATDRLKIQEAIYKVEQATSVAAEGNVTVLYSGNVNGEGSFPIAAKMADDPNVRVLDKTKAFDLLNHQDFKDIQAKAFGHESYDEMEKALEQRIGNGKPKADWSGSDWGKYYATPEKVFEGNGETGLWARISKRFAAETEGAVKIMTELPRADSVLLQTELPELFKNNKTLTSAF